MIWFFIGIGVFIVIALFSENEPKKINLPTRKEVEINLKEYSNHYEIDVAGVHLQDYSYPVLNICKELDLITFEAEPDNKYDSDAIKVINSGWHIGYVPMTDTLNLHQILKKEHIAYIEEIEKTGYINVKVKIRYK